MTADLPTLTTADALIAEMQRIRAAHPHDHLRITCVSADSPWFVGRYGFLLHNAKPLPLLPCRGQLGFFRLSFRRESTTSTAEHPQ